MRLCKCFLLTLGLWDPDSVNFLSGARSQEAKKPEARSLALSPIGRRFLAKNFFGFWVFLIFMLGMSVV